MKKKIVSIITTIGITTSAFSGERFTANDILEFCLDKSNYCQVYLNGYLDGISMGLGFYMPKNSYLVGAKTLRNMLIQRLTNHPEQGDEESGIILGSLLLETNNLKSRKNISDT